MKYRHVLWGNVCFSITTMVHKVCCLGLFTIKKKSAHVGSLAYGFGQCMRPEAQHAVWLGKLEA